MSNEIQIIHDDAAETIYAIIRNMAGQFLAGATPETFEAANWATYDIALAQVDSTSPPSSGNAAFQGTFPAVAAGFYWLDIYIQAGGSPAQTDWLLRQTLYYWDGTNLRPAGSHLGEVDSTGTETITVQKAIEALLAWSAGKLTVDSATGIATYKGRDGTTTVLTVPMVSDASRNNGTIA